MKICKIIIKGFQQFQDTELDFTGPDGQPLNKICLIGQNGTGKSTVLNLVNGLANGLFGYQAADLIIVRFKTEDNNEFYHIQSSKLEPATHVFVSTAIDSCENWVNEIFQFLAIADHTVIQNDLLLFIRNNFAKEFLPTGDTVGRVMKELQLREEKKELVIFSPAEAEDNHYMRVADCPQTTLNEALALIDKFPVHHVVSKATVSEMWRTLVYLVKKRESEREIFETRDENLDLSKRELIEKFEKDNPEILHELAEIWNHILDRANLEFDVEGARKPVQLSENLEAYIRLKKNGKQHIPYNRLSTGIRDFLFRLGHIYLLFYNRELRTAFLMVDEPENSLFPDFLFDLMELYQKIANPEESPDRTQMFFATHNPIVAAQFEPHERIILEWQDDGSVKAHKGRAPVGDDPNDVLRKDFELTSLLGKAGQEKWQRYLELKEWARHEKNSEKKIELIDEALKIGSDYNFPSGISTSKSQ